MASVYFAATYPPPNGRRLIASAAMWTRRAQGFVEDQIAPYKYPREIAFLDALPKTATGKLKRSELRGR